MADIFKVLIWNNQSFMNLHTCTHWKSALVITGTPNFSLIWSQVYIYIDSPVIHICCTCIQLNVTACVNWYYVSISNENSMRSRASQANWILDHKEYPRCSPALFRPWKILAENSETGISLVWKSQIGFCFIHFE